MRLDFLDLDRQRHVPIGIENNFLHVGREDRRLRIVLAGDDALGMDDLAVLDDAEHELGHVHPDMQAAHVLGHVAPALHVGEQLGGAAGALLDGPFLGRTDPARSHSAHCVSRCSGYDQARRPAALVLRDGCRQFVVEELGLFLCRHAQPLPQAARHGDVSVRAAAWGPPESGSMPYRWQSVPPRPGRCDPSIASAGRPAAVSRIADSGDAGGADRRRDRPSPKWKRSPIWDRRAAP